jgi:transposase
MYVKIRRRHHANHTYEYVDIVESVRIGAKVVRRRLGTLGLRQDLPPHKIDALIEHLRKLASPEGLRGISLGEMEIRAVREYGVTLVTHHLWRQLGLEKLLDGLTQSRSAPVSEAVFRMVVNRLCDPTSKLGLVDWTDERGNPHHGWQGQVQWPNGNHALDHNHYLRSMDRLHPHRQELEDRLFSRVTDLLSLPLRLVFYDLTSTYFEGDGVSELAEYGYSRDHRGDRAQVVIGLAVTQEGLPITHRVFPGSTVDVTTLEPMADELRQRFGLQEAVLVADRGMFSADNVAALGLSGQRYILALRSRQQAEGELALDLAHLAGLPRPRDVKAEWQWQEVDAIPGLRHVVVYSAFKARHDFEVRERRLRRAFDELRQLRERAGRDQLGARQIIERVTKIVNRHKCARYVIYEAADGALNFGLDRDQYRQQRRHDGVFVLETNHPTLTTAEIVQSYRQLMEVERAFRMLKSLVKVRPVYHHRDRRVETHLFICFLAYLLAKVLEQHLRQAGLTHSVAHALEILKRLQAVEHTWEDQAVVVKATKPDADVTKILDALGLRIDNPVLHVSRIMPPAVDDANTSEPRA